MNSKKQSKVVVLFEVKPTEEGMKHYLELATGLKQLLSEAKDLSVPNDLQV